MSKSHTKHGNEQALEPGVTEQRERLVGNLAFLIVRMFRRRKSDTSKKSRRFTNNKRPK